MPQYLALDLGASSGRAVLGTLDGERMRLDELHRFETPLVERADGHLVWDLDALEADVREGLRRGLAAAPGLRSVSVDAWGVDYVPLGADGQPLRAPFAYRDARTDGGMDRAFARMPREAVYRHTGIQFMPINTLVQVLSDPASERAATANRLFIADSLNHRLGGRAVVDATIASTSQLLDVHTRTWSAAVLDGVGLGTQGWPEIVAPGTRTGHVTTAPAVAVVASCSHDTACAVAAVPADEATRWAYLSLGTWALVGVERAAPVLSDAACAANVTNEAGLDGTVRVLKNITGLWLLEEVMRDERAAGRSADAATLVGEAEASDYAGTFDPDDPALAAPGGMPRRLAGALAANGHAAPETRGALVRAILRSLAAAVAARLDQLDALAGSSTEVLHVVGGGSRNAVLCRLIADASRRTVVAGPAEATALGNLLVQARTMGDLPDGVTVRAAARASVETVRYTPA